MVIKELAAEADGVTVSIMVTEPGPADVLCRNILVKKGVDEICRFDEDSI